jgi:hypothetical protein
MSFKITRRRTPRLGCDRAAGLIVAQGLIVPQAVQPAANIARSLTTVNRPFASLAADWTVCGTIAGCGTMQSAAHYY